MILSRGLYSDNLSGNTGAPRHLIPSSKLEPISVKILNQNCLHFLSDSVGHSMPYVTLRQKYKMKIFLRNSIIVFCFSTCNSEMTKRKYLLSSRVTVVPEPGGPGGPLAPPIFGRSVNPIRTGGGQIIPTYYYWPLQCFSPSGITVLEHHCWATLYIGFGNVIKN